MNVCEPGPPRSRGVFPGQPAGFGLAERLGPGCAALPIDNAFHMLDEPRIQAEYGTTKLLY